MTIPSETIHYDNGRGISVTDTHLHTRFKDEVLAPVQSVQVGREPFMIAAIVGLGLILFANSFGDLLLFHEQVVLVLTGLSVLAAGYSIAALRIGQYMHEKTVLWHTVWTISAVRSAIAKAQQKQSAATSGVIIANSKAEE